MTLKTQKMDRINKSDLLLEIVTVDTILNLNWSHDCQFMDLVGRVWPPGGSLPMPYGRYGTKINNECKTSPAGGS